MRAMRRLRTSEERARHWDAVYTGAEESRLSWFEDEPRCSIEMLAALGARPRDPVLDVGTGASRLIDALLERGFGDVTALDICPAGPRRIRERLGPAAPPIQWIVHDLLRWVPSRRYAIWHDRGLYHFLTARADRARYHDLLDAALLPGDGVVIGAFAADGPARCAGLRTARYSPAQLGRMLGHATVCETVAVTRRCTPPRVASCSPSPGSRHAGGERTRPTQARHPPGAGWGAR